MIVQIHNWQVEQVEQLSIPPDEQKTLICEQIAQLESHLFAQDAWSLAMVEQELQAPYRTYFLDISNTADLKIRGYAGFWYDGDDAQIMTIGVAQEYQHRGIGSALLTHMCQSAATMGAKRMLLEVRVDNTAALQLYQRFGFETMGLRKRYYQPQGIDAYTMALQLYS